ncbi:hypothetical protein HanPSC8_Chr05g0189451 [Helianthus annuus]|nr:hypothetical protein HanPSC8_Chr05g0189451 [Helianthus annuus]
MDVKERCIGMCAIYFLANENSPFVYVMCVWADGCGGGGVVTRICAGGPNYDKKTRKRVIRLMLS